MEWHSVFFNTQNIIRQTEYSTLIMMPNKSPYPGFSFWMSKKLITEQGGRGSHAAFRFNEEFTFIIKKYGRGRYNFRQVISEQTLSASEMLIAWDMVSSNVHSSVEAETDKLIEKECFNRDIVVEYHRPVIITSKTIIAHDDLIK